ncbi:MAG TPA: ATP synthase F1 subunit gamma, partial [Bacteroidota bacterium]|nr:ATP synthase F1 subunit gamma [Bacteroidota bacterium]
MATLREIRRRIGGIKSTQKITKAMKMVAAAKLRRAQDAVIAARPYARKMKELLNHLAARVDVNVHPHFAVRPVKKAAIIVVTADRGLCGAFNSNLIRAAAAHSKQQYGELQASGAVKLICVGKKGFDFFSRRGYPIARKYIGLFAALQFGAARTIAADAMAGFLGGDYDRIDIVYNEFKSIMQQRIMIEQFLPIAPADTPASIQKSQIDYIYEPSSEAIISALVPKNINVQLWRILLESNAAEQGARMTAMDNATTNASDLIHDLQLSYNKARQASITKELLE